MGRRGRGEMSLDGTRGVDGKPFAYYTNAIHKITIANEALGRGVV
jgi:hypothetical protein